MWYVVKIVFGFKNMRYLLNGDLGPRPTLIISIVMFRRESVVPSLWNERRI